ncbi:MurR/RpiR family transcriptional regulator [Oceanicella actignis]|uniref:MurR/RpiR family transcriptional regulator n=1 Tax=Oceanicella actignis TaxID=1189325 RepID=UPI00125B72C4|nr:MurR/RpiR family transcriptional regulator [Oceanicella actignis]TYO84718.1 RpiR family transcriptional regulator [Oceanicella actignis]
MPNPPLSARIAAFAPKASPAEARVLDWLAEHRETALHASAARIAAEAGTSDATVIRTARKLGFGGLDALRTALAEDLRRDLSLTDRMAGEVVRANARAPLAGAVNALRAALDAIERIDAAQIRQVAEQIVAARRVHAFGIGPSGFVAGYMAAQLARLGIDARALTSSGLQFADDLVGVARGDVVLALAHDRLYPEVRALFDRTQALGLFSVLVTSAGDRLPDDRARVTLRAPRGRARGFGMHAGTLALLEGLLIAVAAAAPERAVAALDALNAARRSISGGGMDL